MWTFTRTYGSHAPGPEPIGNWQSEIGNKRDDQNLRLTLLFVLLLLPITVSAQRDPPVEVVELKSALLGRSINYRILYPIQYYKADKQEKRFPVLYLLHGLTGQSSNWIDRMAALSMPSL